MKGNTIVRKMRALNNIMGDCMEAGQEMNFEERHCGISCKKDKARVYRKMKRAEKTYNNIWKHNVPHKARKAEEKFFNSFPPAPEEKCYVI
jgi:hypothetical protein